MRKILALILVLGTWPAAALAQGVPGTAQVVSSCGTPPGGSYTAGSNQPVLQNTAGQQCGIGQSTVTGTVTANQGTPGSSAWPVSAVPSPSSAAAIGIVPISSTTAESGHVLKASAGNLYSVFVSALTATPGYVMVFNSASVPADGSVTPILCVPIAATPALVTINYGSGPPAVFGTGISIAISSTGCATKTALASGAWFTGAVQ